MAKFPTTNWSAINALRQDDPDLARAVLEGLCALYWQPVYAAVRRTGLRREEARDQTQSFFVHLLQKGGLTAADPERGRFRTFLLACLKNFLSQQRARDQAAKRQPDSGFLSIDDAAAERQYALEPADELTPEEIYHRQWARRTLERAMERLAHEQRGREHGLPFDALRPTLIGDESRVPYRQLAAHHHTTEAAVKMTVKRLRHRLGRCLRAEIGTLVARPDDVDDEMRLVLRLLADSGGGLPQPPA